MCKPAGVARSGLQDRTGAAAALQRVIKHRRSRTRMERRAKEGDSPVGETRVPLVRHLSTAGLVKSRRNLGGPSPKAKYYLATDSELVP